MSIEEGAFKECSGLSSLTIPNNVKYIGDSAFYCCTKLTSISIPTSVTMIGKEAFSGCRRLDAIYLSSSIRTIGPRAFEGCTSLNPKHTFIPENMSVKDKKLFVNSGFLEKGYCDECGSKLIYNSSLNYYYCPKCSEYV